MDLRRNVSLPHLRRHLARWGIVDDRGVDRLTDGMIARLAIKARSSRALASSLSGGNQQKVVFAKAVAKGCRVLLVDEPTQGVDVAGKEEIHALIDELAEQGAAILLITSEMPELLHMSDRIQVLFEGCSMGVLERENADEEAVMRLASGRAAA